MRGLEVKVELTRNCGLNCIHCSSRAGKGIQKEISLSLFDRILKEARDISSIILTGGEPLSCSHIKSILKKCNDSDLLPTIYTSGFLKHSEKKLSIDFLQGKISQLIVSLHGTEIVHDRITGKFGSFTTTINFIKNAIRHDLPVEIHIVALNENIKAIPALVQWLNQFSIAGISILRFVPQGRGIDNRIQPPPKLALKNLWEQLTDKEVRFGAPFNFIRKDKVPCKAGISTISIDIFGRVIPCDSFKDLVNYDVSSNLNYKSLNDIKNGSFLFQYAKNNSIINNKKECCLGQLLLQSQTQKNKLLSYV